jgi:hypothetical protein
MVDLLIIVAAGENVVQEGSNLKILRVTEGWFIDYCGRRRECGTGEEQPEAFVCNCGLIN